MKWPSVGWLIQKGSLQLSSSKQKRQFKAGYWVFPGNEFDWQEFSQDAEIISVRFSMVWRDGTSLFDNSRFVTFNSKPFPDLEKKSHALADIMKSCLGDIRNQAALSRESVKTHFTVMTAFHHWLEAYVHTMLALRLKPRAPIETDPRNDTALAWLRDRPFTEPWREEDLAAGCSLSVSQLNRLFVRYQGVTPKVWHAKHRYETACTLLRDSDESIKSIAYALAFSSPENFCTWFRKLNGKTPRAYKKAPA